MNRFRNRTAPAPSLRMTWFATLAMFLALIAAVGSIGLIGMRHQRLEFSDTATQLQDATDAMATLERGTLEVFEPMLTYLYRYSVDPQRIDESQARYRDTAAEIDVAFDDVEATIGDGAGAVALDRARVAWTSIDNAVRNSHEDVPLDELAAAAATGTDPFLTTVWLPYDSLAREIAEVRKQTVSELGDRVDGANRTAQLVGTLVFWSLIVAIGLALLTARRMTRRVLRPLRSLGHAAANLRQAGEPGHETVDVPHAVAEVQELARIVNESSIALRSHHSQLRAQALTDPLTELHNRAGFTEALHALLDDASRGRVAVLFIDLDDFKEVNDTLGHAAGDAVLRAVAHRLTGATRGCEIVARLGGDEFAVAFDVGADPNAALAVAERIRVALLAPVEVGGHRVEVGCSIGIVVGGVGTTSGDGDELLGNADFAMYIAKGQGKNRYELYSPSMHTEVVARMELGRDLTEALPRGQFVLNYQPVFELPTRDLLGFEALIRWQHPTRGLIAPSDFICLAEDSGAIVEIGAWVIDEACAELARLHATHPELTMGVNVSPREFVVPGYADSVIATLERHGVEPRHLVIEITEETAMTNTEVGATAVATLRELGVHIALDDFGTGYSSLHYLSDLPVNVVKIDRSFVTARDPHRVSTMEAIVDLAQRLGMFVVAEGVEDTEDLERLSAYGHIGVQGFHFARPMPATEARALVERSAAPSTAGTV